MDRDEFIENLRTTFLWENVCGHIENRNEANVLLQKASLKDNVTAESAFIFGEYIDRQHLYEETAVRIGRAEIRESPCFFILQKSNSSLDNAAQIL